MSQQIFARLKPYNPHRGCKLRRLTLSRHGVSFLQAGVWYKVPASIRADLDAIYQDATDVRSPKAFDIAVDDADRRRIEVQHRMEEEEAAKRAGRPAREFVREYTDADLRQPELATDVPPRMGPPQPPLPPAAARRRVVPAPPPAPEPDPEPDLSMANTKAELLNAAESTGLDVSESMTKREILDAIEGD